MAFNLRNTGAIIPVILILLNLTAPAGETAGVVPSVGLDTHARVVFEPKHELDLVCEINGQILEVIKLPGEAFKTGETLILLDKTISQANHKRALTAVVFAKENLARVTKVQAERTLAKKAEAILEAAKQNLASTKQMQESNDATVVEVENAKRDVTIAQSDLEQLLASEASERARAETELAQAEVELARAAKELHACVITAPFDGRVGSLEVDAHEQVRFGQPLGRLVGDATLRAHFLLSSSMLSVVKPGQDIDIHVPALQTTVKGKITRIAAEVDAASDTVEVIATVENSDHLLRGGLNGWVALDAFAPGESE